MNQDRFTVVLGDYKNVTAPQMSVEVTEEEIAQVLENELNSHAALETVDAPAQLGDTVVIDFAGFLGEEQFEGGTSENYSLKLGSGSFIPGFEEQLVDSKAGDEVEVNVTFPANYHAENLAGKPVVFKCKVHAVQKQRKSELNDAFAQKTYNMPSLNALKEAIRSSIGSQKAQRNAAAIREAVVNQVIAGSEITLTEEYVDRSAEELLGYFAQNLAQQGMNIETYCQYSGMTPEMLKKQLRPQALDRAKASAVLLSIAEAEGMTVTEEEYQAELAAMGRSYQMSAEEMMSRLPAQAKEQISENMLIGRALSLLMENSK